MSFCYLKKILVIALIIIAYIFPLYQYPMDQPRRSHFRGDYVQKDEDLYDACVAGNVEGVRLALEAGANPNRSLSDRHTILIYLVDRHNDDDVEIMRLLLESNADPEVLNAYGATPLEYIEIVRMNQPLTEDDQHNLYQMEARLRMAVAKKRSQMLKEKSQSELEGAKKLYQKVKMGGVLRIGNTGEVRRLLAEGADPEVVIDVTTQEQMPGLFMIAGIYAHSNLKESRIVEIMKLIIPYIKDLNPTFNGRRLLDVLRSDPNRQAVVAIIEQAIRDRGQNVLIAPIEPRVQQPQPEQPQQRGWFGGLFSWGGKG